jgi:rhomboid protease GluP
MGNFVQNLAIGDLTYKQFVVIAFETVKELGWRIRFLSDAGVIGYTDNGGFSWNGELTVKLEDDFASVQCVTVGNVTEDFGRCKTAVEQFITQFEDLKDNFTEDDLHRLYKEYEPEFLPPYEDTLKPDTRPKLLFLDGFLSYFKPVEGYFVTPILINLNILIFIIMVCTGISVFEPNVENMLLWGANSTVHTPDGQWWRLITNCFIHFGVIHLLLNMYALVYVGIMLEPFLGKSKYITAYLLSGITASLVSLWWHDDTVSAGASGAIFGLYGVFLAILSTNHVEKSMRSAMLTSIGVFVVYNLVYGGFKGGTDNAAHIGGLLGGVLIGYMYMPGLKRPDKVKLNRLILSGTVAFILFGSVVALVAMSKSDKFIYVREIREFYKIEDKAMVAVREQENRPDTVILTGLLRGIRFWESGVELLQRLDKLEVSAKIHQKNKLMIRYCQLRMKSFRLIYYATKQQVNSYEPQLQEVNKQIGSTLDNLGAL